MLDKLIATLGPPCCLRSACIVYGSAEVIMCFLGIVDGRYSFVVVFLFFRESVATTQMATGQENDYDGSTEEESENLAWSSLPSGKAECFVF